MLVCSHSCIMTRWWPESRVETSHHLINLSAKCVLVVIDNFYRYWNFMLPDNTKVTGAVFHCQHSFSVVKVNSHINTTCFNQSCYSSGYLVAYKCIKICTTETEILNLTIQGEECLLHLKMLLISFICCDTKLLHQFIKDSRDTWVNVMRC
jgi:hypothetical protein